MAQGTRTGSNPNVADLSGILQLILGRPGGNASYVPAGGGMGGRRGTYAGRSVPAPAGSLRDYGKGYKKAELAAGAAAEAFRPGAGFPGQQAAADRAYQQDVSRIAQLTAQDPELKRYEDARLKAVAAGATPEQVQSAEDIGMQIWQQKYGNTPMGQPGGAVGRFNPLMDRTFGYQSGMSPQEMQAMQATAAPVQVAPGAIPYQQGDLGTRATLETGYDPAQYGLSPNLVEEMKKRLLQQAGK